MTEFQQPVLKSGFLRESVVVFNRQLRMNLRNPAWVLIGVMQLPAARRVWPRLTWGRPLR